MKKVSNLYWINQYAIPLNAAAYYHSLGEEICNGLNSIDYVFLGVSSGGTITGVSQKVKERFSEARIIAVDIVSSVIFGANPQKRSIPGIGSSKVPDILKHDLIDDVIWMDDQETIEMCHNLLEENMISAGGSSVTVYGAIKKYFSGKEIDKKINVVTVFPDMGESYTENIYNEEWKPQSILMNQNR